MGGSWEALTWAKKTRVGKHLDKLVLILMAEKANEQFELYPSKTELAFDCEMAKSTLDSSQQRLEAAGLITIVKRLRFNGAQGRDTMLVNHPEAPHMNGAPIVLDFQGHKLYPQHPDRLRDAGLQWISGGEPNAELPDKGKRKKAKGKGAAQKGVRETDPTPEEGGPGDGPQGVREPDGGGPGDGPPWGPGAGPQIFPTESPTTNQGAGEHESSGVDVVQSVNGWLEGPNAEPPSAAADGPDPAGVRLLRSLRFGVGPKLAGHVVDSWSHVVGAALRSGMDESVVIDKLTSGLPGDNLDSRVRIVVGRRLKDLKATVEQEPQRAVEREQSAEEQAHVTVDRWAARGVAGARQAAGLIGVVFDPEPQRGNLGAEEWLTVRQPELAREFIEQYRADLVTALTTRHAA